MIPPVSIPVFVAVLCVVVVFLLYCVLTSNRIFGHLRRAGISILSAMVVAAAPVGYIDHVHHGRLVATAATGRAVPVLDELFIAWGFVTIVLSIPFFLVATWFVRRRQRRFSGGWQTRGAGQRQAGPRSRVGSGYPDFPPVPQEMSRWPE